MKICQWLLQPCIWLDSDDVNPAIQIKAITYIFLEDEKTGKFRLSRKVLLPKPDGYVEPQPRSNSGGGGKDRRPFKADQN